MQQMTVKEQNQLSILSHKIFEAVSEKHEPTKSMLELVTIQGFEQKKTANVFLRFRHYRGRKKNWKNSKLKGKISRILDCFAVRTSYLLQEYI